MKSKKEVITKRFFSELKKDRGFIVSLLGKNAGKIRRIVFLKWKLYAFWLVGKGLRASASVGLPKELERLVSMEWTNKVDKAIWVEVNKVLLESEASYKEGLEELIKVVEETSKASGKV